MNIVDFSEKLAREGHAGQTRNDKKTPYIEHPLAVRAATQLAIYEYFESKDLAGFVINSEEAFIEKAFLESKLTRLEFKNIIQSVSLLHDVTEENPSFHQAYLYNRFMDEGFDYEKDKVGDILFALLKITKNAGESYYDYLIGAKEHFASRVAKVFDIRHNLSQSPSPKKVDLYKLGIYFLMN